jgi:acylphosphatase
VEKVARHVLVRGSVQGVGFRHHTKVRARELGLTGWVQNLADGRVEVHAEGPEHAVRELEAWLAHGPPAARVLELEARDAAPLSLERFEVRRVRANGA